MSTQNINTVHLVRHGENIANLTGEFSYKLVDYSLTPKGLLQAQQTAAHFKDKNIHEIYSSPLKRARETADIIAQTLKLTCSVKEEFREVNVGTLEGQPPSAENWELHNCIVDDWYNGCYTTTFPGGENFEMVIARMRKGLWEITRNKTHKNIIVVGHGGIFTAVVRGICQHVDLDAVTQRTIHNCSVTEVELTTSENDVIGTLKYWAYHDHLLGEAAQLVPGIPQFEATEQDNV